MRCRLPVAVCMAFASLVIYRGVPGECACSPGQRQSYFYGILTGQKFDEAHELRGYVGGRFAGTTSGNPGRLEEKADQVQFALYLCGESVDTGETVEFRYVRGNTEYQVEVLDGDPSFQGREIEVGTFPELADAELSLKVTGKKAVTASEDSDSSDDEGDAGEDGSPDEDTSTAAVDPDINRDGSVDSSDAAIVLNHVLFPKDSDSGEDDAARFDVTGDGIVNTEDVKEIYRQRYDR